LPGRTALIRPWQSTRGSIYSANKEGKISGCVAKNGSVAKNIVLAQFLVVLQM
jgi:hypothetical protein